MSISKTKQTIAEDFIFSHFHANYCTGGKPIQTGDVGKTLRFLFRDPNSVFKELNKYHIKLKLYYIKTLEQQRSEDAWKLSPSNV